MEEVKHELTSDLGVATFIVLTRIYDVLIMDMKVPANDPERRAAAADALVSAHAKGILLAPPPAYVGTEKAGTEEEPHIPYLDN